MPWVCAIVTGFSFHYVEQEKVERYTSPITIPDSVNNCRNSKEETPEIEYNE